MTLWEAALLGLVQGLTEFIPVSSSAHLVLAQYLLGVNPSEASDLTFEVFVHFGTVLSILTVYSRRVWKIVRETITALAVPSSVPSAYRKNPSFRTAVWILLTLIPTGLAYLAFKDQLEAAFSDPRMASAMLLVTGVLLLLTVLRKYPEGKLTPLKALAIGCAQAFSLIPGISRSGATISAALYQNVRRGEAANFSFLMLLPVVLGATLLKTGELTAAEPSIGWLPLLIGTVVAYLAGIFAIRVVLNFTKRGKLPYFAYYCFFIGALGLLLL